MRSRLSNNWRPVFNQFRIGLITFFVLLLPCSASFAWDCKDTYRCTDYDVCLLDGISIGCSYGAGSAVSGGVKFSNGEIFLIDWAFTDVNGNVINLVDDNFALVNGAKTKFIRQLDACIIFDATSENSAFAYGECSE